MRSQQGLEFHENTSPLAKLLMNNHRVPLWLMEHSAPQLLCSHSLASLLPRRAEERSQQPYLAACESIAVHLV
jgi:hypothetical protein